MKERRPSPCASRAVILTEACVSLALVGLVLTVASLLLTQHARATDYFVNYRRAQLAAESCVDRMRVGALEIVDAEFTDEAGIAYEIRIAEADEAWKPLLHIRVTAVIAGRNGRPARYSLSTYVEPRRTLTGANP